MCGLVGKCKGRDLALLWMQGQGEDIPEASQGRWQELTDITGQKQCPRYKAGNIKPLWTGGQVHYGTCE